MWLGGGGGGGEWVNLITKTAPRSFTIPLLTLAKEPSQSNNLAIADGEQVDLCLSQGH